MEASNSARAQSPRAGRSRSPPVPPRGAITARLQLVIVTDPGPDPDDVKALIVAALAHRRRELLLRGVVCNGGQQPRARAKLARRILDMLGATDVPVGIGSDGKPYEAKAHEFELEGYAGVDERVLLPGFELLRLCVEQAEARSLTVVCISGLRDFADLILERPELVLEKVRAVAIMGGIEFGPGDEATCTPDTTANNVWDVEAATEVYRFCFRRGLRMTVTNGAATPDIPMGVAGTFAEGGDCPLMAYLNRAQYLGLAGLWQRICAQDHELPPNRTKEWFFATFCAVDAQRFEADGLDRLDASSDIRAYLNGTVKPYDVVALMTVLPEHEAAFPCTAVHEVRSVRHLLLMKPEHTIDSKLVVNLLRESFSEAVRIIAAASRD